MRLYDFDECVLMDSKEKNTVKVEPKTISVNISTDGLTEVVIEGIVRDYNWGPKRQIDYPKMFWEMTKIKDVKFNDPATIVFWADGTKTVVKCQDDDIFDPEKGLAMAITKKALGNKGNYCNELKKWLPKDKEATLEYTLNTSLTSTAINDMEKSIAEAFNKLQNQLERSK